MGWIDFNELKERVKITQVAEMLGLETKAAQGKLRCYCQGCKQGDNRSLVITPDKGFYCFVSKEGGDAIQLAAHILGCTVNEAAQKISAHFGQPSAAPKPREESAAKSVASQGFKPLDYLEFDHPAVEAIGFEPEIAQALGIGFSGRGTMNGYVLVPVRLEDGTLCGYVGATELLLPKVWHGIATNVVTFPKKTA